MRNLMLYYNFYFYKKYCSFVLVSIIMSCTHLYALNNPKSSEKPFVFIVPAYNAQEWYKLNLDSIFRQRYNNYRVIYIDDLSTDGTAELVEKYVKQCKQEHRFTLIKNKERSLQLLNRYKAIHSCKDEEIIFILDADDLLPHGEVLNKLNKAYSYGSAWLTYGQMHIWCNKCLKLSQDGIATVVRTPECTHSKGFVSTNPPGWVTLGNKFRERARFFDHPSTFYAWLYKHIKLEDLLYEGKPYPVSTDLAIMYPMLEMAGKYAKCLDDVLYLYNKETPINCSKIYPKIAHSKKNGSYYGKFICDKSTYTCFTAPHYFSPCVPRVLVLLQAKSFAEVQRQLQARSSAKHILQTYLLCDMSEKDFERCDVIVKNQANCLLHKESDGLDSLIVKIRQAIKNFSATHFYVIFDNKASQFNAQLLIGAEKLAATKAAACCFFADEVIPIPESSPIDTHFFAWQPSYHATSKMPSSVLYPISVLKEAHNPISSMNERGPGLLMWRDPRSSLCIGYSIVPQDTRII